MSKGFHRLAPADPWSNKRRPSWEGPSQAALEASHFGAPLVPDLPPVEQKVPLVEFEPGPPKIGRAQAAQMGFTGNQCASCGSMQMVRNGTCEKCNDCGATTGCS